MSDLAIVSHLLEPRVCLFKASLNGYFADIHEY